MDTGIGKQAILLQVKEVERIISSNPKEVREILEEAKQGLKRAKIEKEQALKKLENISVELEKII